MHQYRCTTGFVAQAFCWMTDYEYFPASRPLSFRRLTQVLPDDDCPIIDPPIDGTCFYKDFDGNDHMYLLCNENPKCAGWSCKDNPSDGCWLIGSGYVTLGDAFDQSVWLKRGQAARIGGIITRAGIPGSVVVNMDCTVIHSIADFGRGDSLHKYRPLSVPSLPRWFYRYIDVIDRVDLSVIRFISYSPNRAPFPKDIGNLKNLEFLILTLEMYGKVPSSIRNLSKLRHLQLKGAQVSTSGKLNPILFPEEIGSLTNLESLIVEGLAVRQLPDSLARTQLKSLRINSNELSELSPVIAKLSHLEILDLSYCKLQSISLDLSPMRALKSLSLTQNQISSLDGIRNLPNLEILDLNLNVIEKKQALSGLGTLKNLRTINLSGNRIRAIPKEFSDLPLLESINLFNNLLESIEGLQNCPRIQTLILSTNFLKRLPASVAQMTSIETIDLGINSLESLDGIENLVELTSLRCNNQKLERLPPSFAKLKKLTTLDLSNNLLENANGFRNLPNLVSLDISQNRLQSFPTGLEVSKNLKSINNAIKSVVGDFSNFKLKWIDVNLRGNQIEDFSGLATFPYLQSLNLGANGLKEVPTFLKAEKQLHIYTLFLDENGIVDVSGNFSHITSLTDLYLTRNLIQTVNETIFPKTLKNLYLGFNNFTSIPTSLRDTGVEVLYLINNWINGTSNPDTFPANLQMMFIDNNCFAVEPKIPKVLGVLQRTAAECMQHFKDVSSPRETGSLSSTTMLSSPNATPNEPSPVTTTTLLFNPSDPSLPTTSLRPIPIVNPTLKETKFILATQVGPSVTIQPTNPGDPDNSPDIPSTSVPDNSTVKESSNGILGSKYALPGIAAATMALLILIASFVMIIRRRKHRRAAQVPARTLNFQPAVNPDNVSDMENGMMDGCASPSSKEGLLFRDSGLNLDASYKNESGLFTRLGNGIDAGTSSESGSNCMTDGKDEEPKKPPALRNLHNDAHKDQEDVMSPFEDVGNPDELLPVSLPSVHNWSVEDVQRWMNSVGFREQVVETFRRHQIDGQRLLGLTDRILEEELGISTPSHRSSILMIRARILMKVPGHAAT
ncbi:hypothetical protein HDU97_001983 [Phlyctochytrium planicorne]|nr:hypothetical protein HDU97_001983 [Phlyctochytrium planicorne]